MPGYCVTLHYFWLGVPGKEFMTYEQKIVCTPKSFRILFSEDLASEIHSILGMCHVGLFFPFLSALFTNSALFLNDLLLFSSC